MVHHYSMINTGAEISRRFLCLALDFPFRRVNLRCDGSCEVHIDQAVTKQAPQQLLKVTGNRSIQKPESREISIVSKFWTQRLRVDPACEHGCCPRARISCIVAFQVLITFNNFRGSVFVSSFLSLRCEDNSPQSTAQALEQLLRNCSLAWDRFTGQDGPASEGGVFYITSPRARETGPWFLPDRYSSRPSYHLVVVPSSMGTVFSLAGTDLQSFEDNW